MTIIERIQPVTSLSCCKKDLKKLTPAEAKHLTKLYVIADKLKSEKTIIIAKHNRQIFQTSLDNTSHSRVLLVCSKVYQTTICETQGSKTYAKYGAAEKNRTSDPTLTKGVLYH